MYSLLFNLYITIFKTYIMCTLRQGYQKFSYHLSYPAIDLDSDTETWSTDTFLSPNWLLDFLSLSHCLMSFAFTFSCSFLSLFFLLKERKFILVHWISRHQALGLFKGSRKNWNICYIKKDYLTTTKSKTNKQNNVLLHSQMSFSGLTTGNLCWHAAQHADTLPNKIKAILTTTIHICKT